MRIRNWKKHQHFKDRKPPWIKLYRDLLDDIEWFELESAAAKSLVMLWLIASEKDGELPEVKTLAFRMRITESELKRHVTKLSHWLEHDDIKEISERYQSDSVETETETEREVNKKLLHGEFSNVKLTPEEHTKLQTKFNGRCDQLIERLSRYIAQSGKRYKSHYATILNWGDKDAPMPKEKRGVVM